jgi:hypothetical protein
MSLLQHSAEGLEQEIRPRLGIETSTGHKVRWFLLEGSLQGGMGLGYS